MVVDIDLENKRHIENGIYLISHGSQQLLAISNSIVNVNDGSAIALLCNFSDKDCVINAGTDLGNYEKITDYLLSSIDLSQCGSGDKTELTERPLIEPVTPVSNYNNPYQDPDVQTEQLQTKFGPIKIEKQLSKEERNILIDFIEEFKDVMAFDGRVGTTNLIEHEIDIQGNKPVHVSPNRCSPAQRLDIQTQAKLMIDQDIIEPCKSPWSSPIIIIKKPESKGGGFRFVNDFRAVNKLTKYWAYEIPLASDYFRSLSGNTLFTTLDANSGFWQIPVKLEERDITAFIVPGMGSFRYKKMPMGARCSAQTYQALMDIVLGSLKYEAALVFMDDILVPGKTWCDHINKLRLVFNALKKAGLTLKPQKCVFAATTLRFLGHIIDNKGIKVDLKRLEAITKIPPPDSPKAIRQFLGKCGYFQEFIENYSIITAPLTDLTKKKSKFI
jgi:hypothetical protein